MIQIYKVQLLCKLQWSVSDCPSSKFSLQFFAVFKNEA